MDHLELVARELGEQIQVSVFDCHDIFIPHRRIVQAATYINVRAILEPTGESEPELVRYVCGPPTNDSREPLNPRLFSILVVAFPGSLHLLKRYLHCFMEAGAEDADLPFNLGATALERLLPLHQQAFCGHQWSFLGPVFRDIRRQSVVLHGRVPLPWVEWQEKFHRTPPQDHDPYESDPYESDLPALGSPITDFGGRELDQSSNWVSCSLAKAKIHNDHVDGDFGQQLVRHECDNFVAVKWPKPDDLNGHKHELKALTSSFQHPAAVPLLACLSWGDKNLMVFPWAHGGSLSKLWKDRPTMNLTKDVSQWFLRQCSDITDALCELHNESADEPPLPSPLPPQASEHADIRSRRPHAIHGDIHPGNLFCFRPQSTPLESIKYLGTLKLGDFGSTEFFRKSELENAKIAVPAMNLSYRAPECDVDGPLELAQYSQNCDIFSLGCVWLECIVWLVSGYDEVVRFKTRREAETDDLLDGKWEDYKFFNTLTPWSGLMDSLYKSFSSLSSVSPVVSRPPRKQTWVVKCEVNKQIKVLRKKLESLRASNPNTKFVSDLLDFVQSQMLVVDPNERCSSVAVQAFLADWADHSDTGIRAIGTRRENSWTIISPGWMQGKGILFCCGMFGIGALAKRFELWGHVRDLVKA